MMANISEPKQFNGLVVECEDCGFVYSAKHELFDGGYDCPNCNELNLEAKNKGLREAVIGLLDGVDEYWETLPEGITVIDKAKKTLKGEEVDLLDNRRKL